VCGLGKEGWAASFHMGPWVSVDVHNEHTKRLVGSNACKTDLNCNQLSHTRLVFSLTLFPRCCITVPRAQKYHNCKYCIFRGLEINGSPLRLA
jgi:hypothetical protein